MFLKVFETNLFINTNHWQITESNLEQFSVTDN